MVATAMLLACVVARWRLTHPTLKDAFRRLDVSQVESVAVYHSHFSPALEPEAVLSESDTERVEGLLRQVRLSGEPTQDYQLAHQIGCLHSELEDKYFECAEHTFLR